MRRYISLACLINVFFSFTFGQSQEEKSRFIVELNEFVTNSGFKSSTELCIKANVNNKKTFALGIFFCPEIKKIGGISFHHEIFIFRNKVILNDLIEPHIFYNFIYEKISIPEVLANSRIKGNLTVYTSMEHHVGVGIKINIFKSLYATSEIGFGTYLGSIKKPSAPDPDTGEIRGTNGFGSLVKVGIGYYFL
jgi:hypothetical protein